MPIFRRPAHLPKEGIYPDQAGTLIEGLRRFIGHDNLVKRTSEYRSAERVTNGIRIARLREDQPLIEAFGAYERVTRRRQRPLHTLDDELADLANVAANCHVVLPTLADAVEQHHRDKLIDLNGQLKPLLLEWKTAVHFARTYDADIAWLPVDQSGPEFIARIGELECEVECKRQSHMIVELLGRREADDLADKIIRHVMCIGLRGSLVVRVPSDFDNRSLSETEAWDASLASLSNAGAVDLALPGGLRLEGDLLNAKGHGIDAREWQSSLMDGRRNDARLYSQARAVNQVAVDPVDLQMIGPRRSGMELVEYLWDRKFSKAASQCSGERAAMLVLEWEGIDDPSIFSESDGIRDLLIRTFDEHRHVVAIALRCDTAPVRMNGTFNYSTGAYLTKSEVTSFPEMRDLIRLESPYYVPSNGANGNPDF